MDRLAAVIPCGAGRGGVWKLRGRAELEKMLAGGAGYAVACGHGGQRDLDRCEDRGVAEGADPAQVSSRAVDRGLHQVGSLGSGNHFLEVQAVEEVFDPAAAQAFGLAEGQVCVMIHCGSRGLGHQVCSDQVQIMAKAMARYGITVPDRQLACAPVTSPEGQAYLGAMAAAANYARANRQVLAEAASRALSEAVGTPLHLVYDVAHNLATLETHPADGAPVRLCVHRKGATRALPPGHPGLPADLRDAGQPVLIPGSMGTASYVLAGVAPGSAFSSACHGAGRRMSRHQAARSITGPELRRQLERQGIAVRGASARGLARARYLVPGGRVSQLRSQRRGYRVLRFTADRRELTLQPAHAPVAGRLDLSAHESRSAPTGAAAGVLALLSARQSCRRHPRRR
jgi:tRNA-splicing ligase RtcB (3'-phosphate/5'-hydroxy nucleic acid ligase)